MSYLALKRVMMVAVEADSHVPALGASLEYYHCSGSTDLPARFQDAQ